MIAWAISCTFGLVGMPVPMSGNCRMPASDAAPFEYRSRAVAA
jgi:hypothetical protein